MDTALNFWLFFKNHFYIIFRSCFDTLEGHEATVWAISFDSTGDKLGASWAICYIIMYHCIKQHIYNIIMGLILKWRPINYSFVCMFISPLSLVFTSKFFCFLYMTMRQRGLINMQTKESVIGRHFGIRSIWYIISLYQAGYLTPRWWLSSFILVFHLGSFSNLKYAASKR